MGYQLMDIVSEWIAQKGRPESQRSRIYAIAVAGLRELHMDINGIVKIVELSINDNDTVDLTQDFIRYTRIGIVGRDGRIISMNQDNSISTLPVVNDCGTPIAPTQYNAGAVDFPFNGYFYGLNLTNGGQFGLGGGQSSIGYYRYDRATNQLLLANMNQYLSRQIVMEYVADLSSTDGDFFVSPFVIQAIKDWISWQIDYDNKNVSAGEKMTKRNEYFNSRRLANNRYSSSTAEEWATQLRESNMASPRF
jgi:hypothetical protein